MEAIKSENYFDLLVCEIVRFENDKKMPFTFSISARTLANVGLCHHTDATDVARRLGGTVSGSMKRRNIRVHFADTYKLEKFFSVVKDMLFYQEYLNNKYPE